VNSRAGVALQVIGDSDLLAFPSEFKPYVQSRSAGDIKVNMLVHYSWQWDLAVTVSDRAGRPTSTFRQSSTAGLEGGIACRSRSMLEAGSKALRRQLIVDEACDRRGRRAEVIALKVLRSAARPRTRSNSTAQKTDVA